MERKRAGLAVAKADNRVVNLLNMRGLAGMKQTFQGETARGGSRRTAGKGMGEVNRLFWPPGQRIREILLSTLRKRRQRVVREMPSRRAVSV